MSYESDLRAHLLGASGITTLVGERIYPITRPQNSVLPAITYTRIFGNPVQSIGGFTSATSEIRIQIDCWASTYDQVQALALAVRDRMFVTAATFRSYMQSDTDFYEDDTKIYRVSMDFNSVFNG